MKKTVIEKASLYCTEEPEKRYQAELPEQVHEVLIRYGAMENPVLTHDGTESIEISKKDWVYECSFQREEAADKIYLLCKGLDTITEIRLNGKKIGMHQDMYFPFFCEITDNVQENNILTFHFTSPIRYLEDYKKEKGMEYPIDRSHYIRKATHDYADFLGIKPYFCPIGIFEEVEIWYCREARIEETQINSRLNDTLSEGELEIQVRGDMYGAGTISVQVKVTDPWGNCAGQEEREIRMEVPGKTETAIVVPVKQAALWWPAGYGEQHLYTVEVSVLRDGRILDSCRKKTGFRLVEAKGEFDFRINRCKVRLWGANFVPMDGLTHRFDRERAEQLFQMAAEGNMNTIRLWGGGEPYPDELLQIADEKGILLWGEFFHNYGMFPETEKFLELCEKEAEYMITSFRHHPSLLLWSGGNECQMCGEVLWPDQPFQGEKVFRMYERKVRELDPDRYFILNSPMGGEFYNDPRKGDMHGWNNIWYVPYEDYPVLFSEDSRVSVPVLRSMKKFLPDEAEFWPEGFVPRRTRFGEELLPPAWRKLCGGPETYRCSPIEQFYDADTPEDLIYQCGSAHGLFMKKMGERIKRGRPGGTTPEALICQGHLIWKFNDTWPMIFCGLVDYNLEPGMAYYYVKRSFSPLQISIDMERHLAAWIVNDTKEEFRGKAGVCLIQTEGCKVLKRLEQEVFVPAGTSLETLNLDAFGMFYRDCLLYSYLLDENGKVQAVNYDFTEIERNLKFPDANLTLVQEGDRLIMETDQYARSIELRGYSEETEFGFRFSDNYFDLLPFEKKEIRMLGENRPSRVAAKAHYSSIETEIEIQKEE